MEVTNSRTEPNMSGRVLCGMREAISFVSHIARIAIMAAGLGVIGCTATASGDGSEEPVRVVTSSGALRALSSEPVPHATGGHIVDQRAAVRLGKALFWDVQTGGDGKTACASCHFLARADDRLVNTLNPGPGLNNPFASGGVTGPGQLFTPGNIVNDDRVGSQGVVAATFAGIDPDPSHPADVCAAAPSTPFASERQVTGRNAPTVIGAVFFRDVFWDGRANHVFNGNDPFGTTGNAGEAQASVANAALASQAVGPANNNVEMSCKGRPFNGDNSLATKLLARTALQLQRVSPGDSVLGALASADGPGLVCGGEPCNYDDLIRPAFGDALADDAEHSFSIIWGEAIQAYEATLIPDQTPFDRYLAGTSSALNAQQQRGLDVFQGKGNCTKCHSGALLSDASVSLFQSSGATNR